MGEYKIDLFDAVNAYNACRAKHADALWQHAQAMAVYNRPCGS